MNVRGPLDCFYAILFLSFILMMCILGLQYFTVGKFQVCWVEDQVKVSHVLSLTVESCGIK